MRIAKAFLTPPQTKRSIFDRGVIKMSDQILVSEAMLASLNATRPWVKFLAILGFIACGLMVLGGLVILAGSAMLPAQPGPFASFRPVLGVVYIVFAPVYFFYCRYMWRYAKAIASIPATGQAAMEQALSAQKSLWKFLGVLAIVVIGIYVVVLISAVAIGVMAAKAG
jgi:uncharacterized membrane protein SirB2